MSYSSNVNALTAEQRLHFYEVFAHNITVAIRGVWSDETLADAEKVEQIKWINEILHRVTGKIGVLRLKTHEWTEEDFAALIHDYVDKCPAIRSPISWAIQSSLTSVHHAGA